MTRNTMYYRAMVADLETIKKINDSIIFHMPGFALRKRPINAALAKAKEALERKEKHADNKSK